jgi:hypothetical protein
MAGKNTSVKSGTFPLRDASLLQQHIEPTFTEQVMARLRSTEENEINCTSTRQQRMQRS